jgi:hypothetical protein
VCMRARAPARGGGLEVVQPYFDSLTVVLDMITVILRSQERKEKNTQQSNRFDSRTY